MTDHPTVDLPALLCLVGKSRIGDELVHLLGPLRPRRDGVLRLVDGHPYSVPLPGLGLDLLLQCLKPQAPSATESDWCLVGITLHTRHSFGSAFVWEGPWLGDVQPATFSPAQAMAFWGPSFRMSGNVGHGSMPGTGGVRWTIVCIFHANGLLESLAVLGAEDHRPLELRGPVWPA